MLTSSAGRLYIAERYISAIIAMIYGQNNRLHIQGSVWLQPAHRPSGDLRLSLQTANTILQAATHKKCSQISSISVYTPSVRLHTPIFHFYIGQPNSANSCSLRHSVLNRL